jgi:predicted nucleic acid-binding protein
MAKAEKARSILRQPAVALSLQVLGEFYNASTSRRRIQPLTHDEAAAWIDVWKLLILHVPTLETIEIALRNCARYHIQYYDALILASARQMNCHTLLSEDLNDGQVYDDVRVLNPFK